MPRHARYDDPNSELAGVSPNGPRVQPPYAVAPTPPEADAELERISSITEWMDRRWLDPLLGFFLPGVGDLMSSSFGLYTVWVATRRRLPPVVIARMLLNLGIDAGVGAIPIVGDVFDAMYQAHRKNERLLRERRPNQPAKASDWLVVVGAALLFLGAMALPIIAVVSLVGWLF